MDWNAIYDSLCGACKNACTRIVGARRDPVRIQAAVKAAHSSGQLCGECTAALPPEALAPWQRIGNKS